jgi:hypothetical protein
MVAIAYQRRAVRVEFFFFLFLLLGISLLAVRQKEPSIQPTSWPAVCNSDSKVRAACCCLEETFTYKTAKRRRDTATSAAAAAAAALAIPFSMMTKKASLKRSPLIPQEKTKNQSA